jgi:hypothetical protein
MVWLGFEENRSREGGAGKKEKERKEGPQIGRQVSYLLSNSWKSLMFAA